jgi:acetolactate synthase-1/2/3 large subunit
MTGDLLRRGVQGPAGPDSGDPARSRELAPSDESAPSRRAAAEIVGALCQAGTQLVFGVPGGGPNLEVVGAAAQAGLQFVLAHSETAAAIMAATCADLTGVPGAVLVTRGPGLASAINGIAHATLDRLPLVVIADTVPDRDRDRISHQRLDQDALGRAVAKAAITLGTGAEEVAELAVRLALTQPAGAVVVNVDPDASSSAGPAATPDNAQQPGSAGGHEATTDNAQQREDTADDETTPDDAQRGDTADREAMPDNAQQRGGAGGHGAAPDDAGPDLALLGEALQAARRPVVLLGPGALGHASAIRAALAGSGVPVLHTYRARGIMPDSGAEAAGLFTGGTMEAPLLAAADLIVGLGVDPVELIPASWDYAAATILVSEYPAGSAAYFTRATERIAPLPAAIEMLAAHRAGREWPAGAGQTAKQDVTIRLGWVAVGAPGRLTPYDVVTTARAHAPAQTIATVDSGAHMLAVMPLWPVDEPHRLLISSGLATMGYALPAAIGAALCTPGVPVIAFTGDGGLGMTLMELETAVRLRLRVIVVVFNDSALSLIKIKQRPAGQGGDEAVSYGPTSFAAAAEAMGAAAASVSDPAGLADALTTALGREGPTLIDARVDPAGYPAILDLTRGETGRRSSRDRNAAMRNGLIETPAPPEH